MYDELVKRLRIAAQLADKGLVITPSTCLEAADVIEELSATISKMEKATHWMPLHEPQKEEGEQ